MPDKRKKGRVDARTVEDRIREEFKRINTRGMVYHDRTGLIEPAVMRLARRWKRPIREIRLILDYPAKPSYPNRYRGDGSECGGPGFCEFCI